ncbi:MAG: GNAT family N-acetyltransferase [Methylobacterium sp.]|uniref:GNAT family N-acetyltransferase n=1 Tax=Methylobacterium sp. TaxID=409 RepID=UPI0025E66F7A|nr:GNAT family N-acetyltransferase [Methylobacterium sp.]MBX9934830.1 GNAT family N-acetyltransferase [Methylobacterium sp.]
MEIEYRAAAPQDAEALTDLMLQAGGDTLQFVLDGLAPGVSAWALYAHMVCSTESECSYRHCLVAEVGAAVVGMANAFPTARLRDEPHAFALSQREIHIRQRTEVQDWGSYCLNNIAVAPLFQGQGIAARLIDLVGEKARSEGFDRLTLHVWGDNARARSLYRRKGFEEIGWAAVGWHPALPHVGGSLLMQLSLAAGRQPAASAAVQAVAPLSRRCDDRLNPPCVP